MCDKGGAKKRSKRAVMKTLLLTGCFDVLHLGHTRIIQYANSLCDRIVIAIDGDEKVRREKGRHRPFNTQEDRKELLDNIKGVNEVYIFHSERDLEILCEELLPNYRLVGSDWRGKKIVGAEHCKEIVYYDRISGYSTTNILENKQ